MKKAFATVLCIVLCLTLAAGCDTGAKQGKAGESAPAATNELIDNASPENTTGDFSLFGTDETQATASFGGTKTETVEETATPVEATATPVLEQTPQPTAPVSTLSGKDENITEADLQEFFKQVVFGTTAGSTVRKWVSPIIVSLTGNYNAKDEEQLTNIFDMLNDYDSFPGVHYVSAEDAGNVMNMLVKFVTADELSAEPVDWDGKSPLWTSRYKDSNGNISKSIIYLVSGDVPEQSQRNYLLTWGVFYSIGFSYRSSIYYDSIFNPNFNGDALGGEFISPVAADWRLVSMLYSPTVKSGMTYEQAVASFDN